MYRVLIVDDEPIIADGLYDELLLIDGPDLDVYKAYSGTGALELLANHRIDVVVTDIKMPGMDGMALLERIKDSWPECKVIFLTGHREFDYVYMAIQHRGLQYVLKTEGYEKVISAVRSAISEIGSELELNGRLEDMRRRMDTASMFLQKDFLKRLLECGSAAGPNMVDLKECGIVLNAYGPLLVIAGRVSNPAEPLSFAGLIRSFQAVKLVSEQYLASRMLLAAIPDDQSDIIILAQPIKLMEQKTQAEQDTMWNNALLFAKETLELMQTSVKAVLGLTISFGMASSPVPWNGLPQAYEAVKRMLDSRIGTGNEMLLTENGAGPGRHWPEPAREWAGKIKPKADALSVLLDRGEQEEYFKAFDSLYAIFESACVLHDTLANEAYYSIALMLLSHMNRWQLHDKVAPPVDPGMLLKADKFPTWAQAAKYLRQLSTALFDLQRADQDRRAADILKRLKSYINCHLGEDLSLLKLSELMFFNPSYLSRLFKQLSGENLTDYIQNKRVDKAKVMLEKKETKISDIAPAVGFGSATNFTRFFKKVSGMTPQEYRDRLSAGKAGIQM